MITNPYGFQNPHSFNNKLLRLLWGFVYYLFFRYSPWFLNKWRIFLLRIFGAKIGQASIPGSVKVWAPWRLEIGDNVRLDEDVFLYNVFGIKINDRVIISRSTFLCTATHDYADPTYPLTGEEIVVESDVWVTADCFIAPGVVVSKGSVVLARSVVLRKFEAWKVLAGNPAKVVKDRLMKG